MSSQSRNYYHHDNFTALWVPFKNSLTLKYINNSARGWINYKEIMHDSIAHSSQTLKKTSPKARTSAAGWRNPCPRVHHLDASATAGRIDWKRNAIVWRAAPGERGAPPSHQSIIVGSQRENFSSTQQPVCGGCNVRPSLRISLMPGPPSDTQTHILGGAFCRGNFGSSGAQRSKGGAGGCTLPALSALLTLGVWLSRARMLCEFSAGWAGRLNYPFPPGRVWN